MRILIVDGHRMFAESVARMLVSDERVSSVQVGASVLELRRDPPASVDVALVDWQLSDGDAIDAAAIIRAGSPAVHLLVLTSDATPLMLRAAIDAGFSGLIGKEGPTSDIFTAIDSVHTGDLAVPPALAVQMSRLTNSSEQGPLSKREVEVLDGIAHGQSNREIADALYVSENTVRNHVARIFRNLGVGNRLDAALTGIRQGIISMPDEPPP